MTLISRFIPVLPAYQTNETIPGRTGNVCFHEFYYTWPRKHCVRCVLCAVCRVLRAALLVCELCSCAVCVLCCTGLHSACCAVLCCVLCCIVCICAPMLECVLYSTVMCCSVTH